MLFLVDGVRINSRLYAGATPLDTLPSAIVDRIEILEGGQSLFYGTQAVAGAVNIVTKPFFSTPDGQASVAADTSGDRPIDAYYRGAVGRSEFVLYGSADKSDGYKAFRAEDYLRLSASYQHTDADLDYALPYRVAKDESDRQEDLATVKLDWDVSDRLSLFVKGYYHNWGAKYDTDAAPDPQRPPRRWIPLQRPERRPVRHGVERERPV